MSFSTTENLKITKIFKKADKFLEELNAKKELVELLTAGFLGGSQVQQVITVWLKLFSIQRFPPYLELFLFEMNILTEWIGVEKKF